MDKNIGEIVAGFLKISQSQLLPETKVDRKTLGSSIFLHRMYARLAEHGVIVEDYHNITTYSDILSRTNKKEGNSSVISPSIKYENIHSPSIASAATPPFQIGIDIEYVNKFALVDDFRADKFYSMNFSQQEISYAILQPDPVLTFAGLFAAKEAIVKAKNSFLSVPFNEIEIKHNKEGKPYHNGISLSIAHISELAVAVAVVLEEKELQHAGSTHLDNNKDSTPGFNIVAWIAILLSLISFSLLFFK
jgi:phosphopantetheine--protein transferase-like protein